MSPSMVALLGTLLLIAAALAFAVAIGVIGGGKSKGENDVLTPSVGARIRDRVRTEDRQLFVRRGAIARIERELTLAGSPSGWTAAGVITAKTIGLAVGALILVLAMVSGPGFLKLFAGGLAVVLGYFYPDVRLRSIRQERQKVIQRELPDVLDQVTMSLESGLGFEAAFSHVGQRRTGPLAEEVLRTVQDMRLGLSRRDAYEALAERTDVQDLNRFVRAIVQAEQHGVSVSKVVRGQAHEMRYTRKKRAEANAQRVPIKILAPLFVCIFPVLFAVILTPAFISIGKSL